MPSLEIIKIPPGQAPENIRKDWVGCIMPFVSNNLDTSEPIGIYGGPVQNRGGYTVEASSAIISLTIKQRTEAGIFWEQYFGNDLGLAYLVFNRNVCREVPDKELKDSYRLKQRAKPKAVKGILGKMKRHK